MKKIFINIITLAIIINPVFVLAQTAETSVKPPAKTEVAGSSDVLTLIKEVLKIVRGLQTEIKILKTDISELRKGQLPPRPIYNPGGLLEGVSEADCRNNSKYISQGALWSAEYNTCYIPSFCPLIAASAVYPPNCPAGTQPQYRKTPPWLCYSNDYDCVPIKPIVTVCEAGYVAKGPLCDNILTGQVYKQKEGVKTAKALTDFAKSEWGITFNCGLLKKLELNLDGTSASCVFSSTGVTVPVTQWPIINWTGSDQKGLWSYADPNVTEGEIKAARAIIAAGCPNVSSKSDVSWNSKGVPVACGPSNFDTTYNFSSYDDWKVCFKAEAAKDGATTAEITTTLAETDRAIAARVNVNYTATARSTDNAVNRCENRVGWRLSSVTGATNTGTGTTGGGGGAVSLADFKKCLVDKGSIPTSVIEDMVNCQSGSCTTDPARSAAMSQYSSQSSSCYSSYSGGGTGTGGGYSSGSCTDPAPLWTGWSCVTNSECTSGGGVVNTNAAPNRCDGLTTSGGSAYNFSGSTSGSFDCSSLTSMPGYSNRSGWHSMGNSDSNGKQLCFADGMTRFTRITNQAPSGVEDCSGYNQPVSSCTSAPTVSYSDFRPSLLAQLLFWLTSR